MLSHTSRYFTYAPSVASTSAETRTTDTQPMMVMRREGRGRTPWRRRQLHRPPRGAREPATLLSSEPLITPPGRGSDRSVRAADGQAASAAWGPAESRLGIDHILPSWPRLTRSSSYPGRRVLARLPGGHCPRGVRSRASRTCSTWPGLATVLPAWSATALTQRAGDGSHGTSCLRLSRKGLARVAS